MSTESPQVQIFGSDFFFNFPLRRPRSQPPDCYPHMLEYICDYVGTRNILRLFNGGTFAFYVPLREDLPEF